MKNSITEEELNNFFDVKGNPLDKCMQWPYNDYLYDVTNGTISLSFSIHPAFKDIRVSVQYQNADLVDLSYQEFKDITVTRDEQGPYLSIQLTDTTQLTIRQTPSISVVHTCTNQDNKLF